MSQDQEHHGSKGEMDDLIRRLAEAEAEIQALASDCVDAVLDPKTATPILLRKAQKALIANNEELERRVQERTADLQRANESLSRSEQQYRLLFETMLQGVIYQDADGKIFSMNPAAERILGKTKAELLGSSTSGHDRHAIREDGSSFPGQEHPAAVSSRTGQTVKDVVMGVHNPQEKGYRWINICAVPLFRPGEDRPCQVYTLFDDITERKQASDWLRKARDELEQRVRERTAELQNAKDELESINKELSVEIEEHKQTEKELMAAKEAAEAATRAKAEFLANMSHEIRTPMNAVIGMTSLLIDNENLTLEQKDFIETIRSSGDALMTIINDILDFSKMESDKVMLEEQTFDLRSCVEESLGLVAVKAAEKNLNLAYTIDKNVPDTIIGDPARLRQIILNLLSNAVKFTKIGEVKLLISGQKLDETYEIHFAISDTGIGIPEDQMNRLFQPFSQVDASITRKYGGTGLGLAISQQLVEMMGGRIWVESKEGRGSTFHFTINVLSLQGQLKSPLSGVQPELVGKKILIIDDNKTNRRILGGYAYSWGMIPMIAKSGQEALRWIQRGDDFGIAILDMNMPDMDGLTLAGEIRKYNKTLPLVMLTSIGQHVPSDHAYLVKPIKPSQLYDILVEAFAKRPIQETVQAPAVKKTQDKPQRILLAEDNVSSQKVVTAMLSRLGYKSDAVANGIEALQALERQPYDIVLMDIRMPEMDGLEATRIIRQRWPDNGPKVIAITAYALEGDREKCLAAGMDGYIPKPVQMDELAEMLERYSPRKVFNLSRGSP